MVGMRISGNMDREYRYGSLRILLNGILSKHDLYHPVHLSPSSSSDDDTAVLSGIGRSRYGENEFQYYYAGDVAIVPVRSMNVAVVTLKEGRFRLEWDYAASPCIPAGESSVEGQARTPVASGTEFFSVVGDGTGVDFDIPVNAECPSFGDSWSFQRKEDCPAVKTKGEKAASGGPCKARLTSREQVKCIWEYVSGGGE